MARLPGHCEVLCADDAHTEAADPQGHATVTEQAARSATRRRRRERVIRRIRWVVASQGLSSLSNFGLTIIVARTVDQTAFGWFALALSFYGVTLSVTRAAVAQPLAIRFAADPDRRGDAIAGAGGAAIVVGLMGALVMLVTAAVVAVTGGEAGSLAVTGAFLPAVDSNADRRMGRSRAGGGTLRGLAAETPARGPGGALLLSPAP
jgi:hypothetical protein